MTNKSLENLKTQADLDYSRPWRELEPPQTGTFDQLLLWDFKQAMELFINWGNLCIVFYKVRIITVAFKLVARVD